MRSMFTYTHIHQDKEQLLAFMRTIAPVNRAYIVWENASGEISHPHTHCVIEWEKAYQTRNVRKFDFGEVPDGNGVRLQHPNIKHLPSLKAFFDAVKYCQKEEFDEDPLSLNCERPEFGDIDKILDAESRIDAIRKSGLKMATQASLVWGLRPRPAMSELLNIPLREWQEDVDTMLETDPKGNTRYLHWFYDKRGACGKSHLVKYLRAKYDKKVYNVSHFGGMRDAATIVRNAFDAEWTGEIFIADLPRDCEGKSIYEPMEAILNGEVTATKYQGGTESWRGTSYLFVFANFLPDIHRMSHDRWRIFEIKDYKAFPLTLSMVETLNRMEIIQ